MAEKMDLHDRVEFALRDAGFDLDEASWIATLAEAHPYQPAQAVDVGAIRKVIASMRKEANGFDFVKRWREKLTRAIGNAQADD